LLLLVLVLLALLLLLLGTITGFAQIVQRRRLPPRSLPILLKELLLGAEGLGNSLFVVEK
jgi:hypothetical protein